MRWRLIVYEALARSICLPACRVSAPPSPALVWKPPACLSASAATHRLDPFPSRSGRGAHLSVCPNSKASWGRLRGPSILNPNSLKKARARHSKDAVSWRPRRLLWVTSDLHTSRASRPLSARKRTRLTDCDRQLGQSGRVADFGIPLKENVRHHKCAENLEKVLISLGRGHL